MKKIKFEDLDALIQEQITDKSRDFGLNCNLEDPSDEEKAAFNVGVDFALWILRKGVKPSYGD